MKMLYYEETSSFSRKLLGCCHYEVLGTKTILTKLIFDLQLGDQLADALLEEIYIHSKYVLYLCSWNNFSVLITKRIINFS